MSTNNRRTKLSLAILAIVAVGVWYWNSRREYLHRLPPNGSATTLAESVSSNGPFTDIQTVSIDGKDEYLVLFGRGGLLSGPPCYVFDVSGRFVGWSEDTFDTPINMPNVALADWHRGKWNRIGQRELEEFVAQLR